jgi:hypothetical protein
VVNGLLKLRLSLSLLLPVHSIRMLLTSFQTNLLALCATVTAVTNPAAMTVIAVTNPAAMTVTAVTNPAVMTVIAVTNPAVMTVIAVTNPATMTAVTSPVVVALVLTAKIGHAPLSIRVTTPAHIIEFCPPFPFTLFVIMC